MGDGTSRITPAKDRSSRVGLHESGDRILNKKKKLGVSGLCTFRCRIKFNPEDSTQVFTLGGGIDGRIYETTPTATRPCST